MARPRKVTVNLTRDVDWMPRGVKQRQIQKERQAIDVAGGLLVELDDSGQRRVMNYLIDLLDLRVAEDHESVSRITYFTVR